MILAAGDVARELSDRPAWIRGIDHRIEAARPRRARPHPLGLDRAGRRPRPAWPTAGRRRRAARAVQPPGAHPASGARPRRRRRRSTRRAARCAPTRSWPPASSASARPPTASPTARRTGPWPTPRPARACNRTSCASWRVSVMGKERVAIVGIGQTKHEATNDVSIAGLVRAAAQRALDDAGMTWSDIDAVVIGKAPDFFEGVMMPELYLADALGAVGQADVPGAHRRLGRRLDRHRGQRPDRRPACTSGCSPSPSRSSPRARPCGRCRCRCRSSRRCTPAPAATSPRTSARTCAARGRPTTSASSSR